MIHELILRYTWIACVGWALGVAGCADRAVTIPVAVEKPNSTVDEVCKITAELLAVDRSTIAAKTSLGDLGADELDFVELVMELEEMFDVSISDESAERMMGNDNWQLGMKNVTMEKLASLVDEQRQSSQAGNRRVHRPVESLGQSKSESAAAKSSSPVNGAAPGPSQVKVFLNPLVVLLAGAERKKGQPLTREEVLKIRDNAVFVTMSPEQAQEFYTSLDAQVSVHRMNPDRVWEEWQEIRHQVK